MTIDETKPYQLRELPGFRLLSRHRTFFAAMSTAAKTAELAVGAGGLSAEIWDASRPSRPTVLARITI